ncbi:MAG: hypothetical protein ACI9RO_000618 [Alteromonas macleodii]|jgi:hypothetical protein
MKYLVTIAALIGLSACDVSPFFVGLKKSDSTSVAPVSGASFYLSPLCRTEFDLSIRPSLASSQTCLNFPPPPPLDARTVKQFVTSTDQDLLNAVAPSLSGERRLGSTIASLGNPTDPGIWLKTPQVAAVTNGRVEYNGNSVMLLLRPTGGALGSASRISLAAMRLIESPLTGLPELSVYAN